MHSQSSVLSLLLVTVAVLPAPAIATRSDKRGLVFVPNSATPQDNFIWRRPPSDLTWYYNYGSSPSPVYANWTQDEFEFVPQLWGAPSDPSDTTFLTAVKGLVQGGRNISNVLTFNEPDSPYDGGSNVDPAFGAQVWVNNIIPLQKMGIRAGLPAPTGGWGGIPWLDQFLGNCSKIISSGSSTVKNCTYDFVTIHWYGNFEGLASHIGQYAATFPDKDMWVTEYNLNDQDLSTTQSFYNTSAEYLDRLTYIERYSLFGAFRSSVSNVGPNAAMLSAGGKLTDIGSWYLGEDATGVLPTDTKSAAGGPLRPPSVASWSVVAAAVVAPVVVGF